MTRPAQTTLQSIAVGLWAVLSVGCGPSQSIDVEPGAATSQPRSEVVAPKPRVAATSPAVAWLLERLAGPEVEVLALPGARSRPSAELILELSEADLILAHGAGLEQWLAGASLPQSRTVETSGGLDLIELGVRTHSHGAEGEHSHSDPDPRTWEDPMVFLEQARLVRDAVISLLPDQRSAIEIRMQALAADLRGLSSEAESVLAGVDEVRWSSPPGFGGYLARAFSLDYRSFQIAPDQLADPHEIEHYSRWVAGSKRSITLWPTAPSSEVLDSLGGASVHVDLDPLDSATSEGFRYLERSRENLERLRRALNEP